MNVTKPVCTQGEALPADTHRTTGPQTDPHTGPHRTTDGSTHRSTNRTTGPHDHRQVYRTTGPQTGPHTDPQRFCVLLTADWTALMTCASHNKNNKATRTVRRFTCRRHTDTLCSSTSRRTRFALTDSSANKSNLINQSTSHTVLIFTSIKFFFFTLKTFCPLSINQSINQSC